MNHEIWRRTLQEALLKGVTAGVFPGGCAGIAAGPPSCRQFITAAAGRAAVVPRPIGLSLDTVFDLASLTKPLATTLAILLLYAEGRIALEEPLSSLLAKKLSREKARIRLHHLLTHTAGFPPHRPYYLQQEGTPPAAAKEAIVASVLAEPLLDLPGNRSRYSDLGFILLGAIVERKSGMGLDQFVRRRIYGPLGLEQQLFFPVAGWHPPAVIQFAATEDCPWRRRILAGEVHDQNCWAMGGIAGHAGLFGTVEGVLRLTAVLLDGWLGHGTENVFRQQELELFFSWHQSSSQSTWALGFDRPSPEKSSAGRYISRRAVGHLGYTGTSFWIDPDRQLTVVLLTNRVHPTASNERMKEFRPEFHEKIYRQVGSFSEGTALGLFAQT